MEKDIAVSSSSASAERWSCKKNRSKKKGGGGTLKVIWRGVLNFSSGFKRLLWGSIAVRPWGKGEKEESAVAGVGLRADLVTGYLHWSGDVADCSLEKDGING